MTFKIISVVIVCLFLSSWRCADSSAPPEKYRSSLSCTPVMSGALGIRNLSGCVFRCSQLKMFSWVDPFKAPIFMGNRISVENIVRGCVDESKYDVDQILVGNW